MLAFIDDDTYRRGSFALPKMPGDLRELRDPGTPDDEGVNGLVTGTVLP